jgi:hypothetical protein
MGRWTCDYDLSRFVPTTTQDGREYIVREEQTPYYAAIDREGRESHFAHVPLGDFSVYLCSLLYRRFEMGDEGIYPKFNLFNCNCLINPIKICCTIEIFLYDPFFGTRIYEFTKLHWMVPILENVYENNLLKENEKNDFFCILCWACRKKNGKSLPTNVRDLSGLGNLLKYPVVLLCNLILLPLDEKLCDLCTTEYR